MAPEGDFQPYFSTAPRVGTITQWMDDKGYGWVEADGKRWFVHAKDFERGQRRPKSGEEVRFSPGLDPKGRSCAKSVTFVNAGKGRISSGTWILLCLLMLLPTLAFLRLPIPLWAGPSVMLLVSAICFARYANDKNSAVTGSWRVSEPELHLMELLGGWPGAFIAQRRLRHKCSKPAYQVVFWTIVFIHQCAALDVILNHRLSRAVMAALID